MSIRLMIVDDHKLMREGLKRILSQTKDIIVVAEAGDGESAIKVAHTYDPDIILLDIMMPKLDGIETLRRMKDLGVKSRIIMLSAQSSKSYIVNSIKLGASGYLTKDNDSEKLIKVIRDVHSGSTYLQPQLAKILRHNIKEDKINNHDMDKLDSLSKREYEILSLLSSGYNNKQIAIKLFISEKTVKNHITNIFKKLEVEDRVQAVLFSYRNEIIVSSLKDK